MGVTSEFESFEQQVLEIIGEFKSLSTSESRLRDAHCAETSQAEVAEAAALAASKRMRLTPISESRLRDAHRAETSRAEAAEAALAASERAAADASAGAAAASAGAAHAAAGLSRANEEVTAVKVQMEVTERQRSLLEERCSELMQQLAATEREVQQLRPLQGATATLQRQYHELMDRVGMASEAARDEVSRLEAELRRVERCAGGGAEVRERARLAAAAHARERRLAAAELQHTTKELMHANSEIVRLNVLVAEQSRHLSKIDIDLPRTKTVSSTEAEALAEARAALEAERAGAARLERALSAALKDNASLAAELHSEDVAAAPALPSSPKEAGSTTISALDSFLAD